MLALAYPARPMDASRGVDSFTQSFDVVNKTIEFDAGYTERNDKEWIENIDTFVKMASFAARNRAGDPEDLWRKTSRVVKDLQTVLDDQHVSMMFTKREIVRLRKLYHELAAAAGMFSLMADTALQDILCGNIPPEFD